VPALFNAGCDKQKRWACSPGYVEGMTSQAFALCTKNHFGQVSMLTDPKIFRTGQPLNHRSLMNCITTGQPKLQMLKKMRNSVTAWTAIRTSEDDPTELTLAPQARAIVAGVEVDEPDDADEDTARITSAVDEAIEEVYGDSDAA
jgi:hypothetical protein